MKFLHTMIRVKNIDESLKFYTQLLDMKVVKEKRLSDCKLYFLSDNEGYTQLELTYNDSTPKDGYGEGSKFGHLAFETNSFKDFTEKLNKMGYKYLYEPYNLEGISSTIAFIKDPDGNDVEIIGK